MFVLYTSGTIPQESWGTISADWRFNFLTGYFLCLHYRGEASGATLTDCSNGNSRYYIYVCKVRQALGPITPRACACVAETLGKKDLLLRSGLEPGSDALQTTAFATEPMGLW